MWFTTKSRGTIQRTDSCWLPALRTGLRVDRRAKHGVLHMRKQLGQQMLPILNLADYRQAVEALKSRLTGDERATALAFEVEQLVRFESEHGIDIQERLAAQLCAPALPPGQRVALISDIHGNYAGLAAVLSDIENQRCDRIVCLGDLVDGGPDDEQVVATLQQRAIPCVRGNHDENNDLALLAATQEFLLSLPSRIVEGEILYVHISPRPIQRKIDREVEAWNVFDETHYRLVFTGHVHIPLIFGQRCTAYGEAMRHQFEYNKPFALSRDDRYIVSVGSVGYGRDNVGKLRYAIHDRAANTIEFRAVAGPLLRLDHALR